MKACNLKLNLLKVVSLLSICSLSLLTSCGSGVEDRAVNSTSNSDSNGANASALSQEQISSLSELKIAVGLDELGINDYFLDAKALYSSSQFLVLSDFLKINCANSNIQSVVDRYKNYGKIIFDIESDMHVLSILDDLYFEFIAEESPTLNADQLAILSKAFEKLSMYRSQLIVHADKCLNVKLVGVGVPDEEAPSPPSNG